MEAVCHLPRVIYETVPLNFGRRHRREFDAAPNGAGVLMVGRYGRRVHLGPWSGAADFGRVARFDAGKDQTDEIRYFGTRLHPALGPLLGSPPGDSNSRMFAGPFAC